MRKEGVVESRSGLPFLGEVAIDLGSDNFWSEEDTCWLRGKMANRS